MNRDDHNHNALAERIRKLERENRRMKRAGLALAIVSVSLVLMGQAQVTKVVEANEFVLKDASGKMRARLWFGVQPAKSPPIALLDFYDSTGSNSLLTLAADASNDTATVLLGKFGTGPNLRLSADAKGSYVSVGSEGLRGINLSAEPSASTLSLSGTGNIVKGGVYLTDRLKAAIYLSTPLKAAVREFSEVRWTDLMSISPILRDSMFSWECLKPS